MPLFSRARPTPPDVLARIELEPGDRLLASAPLADGDWLVATVHALHRLGGPDGSKPAWRRAWTDVDRAGLDSNTRTLTVRWATGQGEESYPLADAASRSFTRTVNERVTASVVASQDIKVPGGRARIAVRRRPDGELFSQVIVIGTVDAEAPEVANRIDEVEAQLRESCGLD